MMKDLQAFASLGVTVGLDPDSLVVLGEVADGDALVVDVVVFGDFLSNVGVNAGLDTLVLVAEAGDVEVGLGDDEGGKASQAQGQHEGLRDHTIRNSETEVGALFDGIYITVEEDSLRVRWQPGIPCSEPWRCGVGYGVVDE